MKPSFHTPFVAGRRILLVAAASVAAGSCLAQAARPIRLVVPNPPGGMTDLLGRVAAEKLSQAYGRPVVVDNRAGASGHVGAQQVAQAAPDGNTLLLGTIGIHAAHGSYRKLAYDPVAGLVPVTILAESPNVVLVPAASPYKTFAEFLAAARADPAGLQYATAGPGSSVHMVTALFETASGAKVNYVPYKGSGPAMVDLIGGQVNVMFENLPSGMPQLSKRDPRLPDVPTVAEAGLPGYAALSWFTVAAPRGTPPALVEQLAADLRRVMSTPDVKAQLDEQGATLVLDTPAQARRFIAQETVKWNRVIEATRLQLD
jgi:tripartite-type tricarboxylate transporter receptor subunit TctC